MADNKDLLSPDATPTKAPNTSGKRPTIRRLNKMPIIIIVSIAVGVVFLMGLVAMSKGKNFRATATAEVAPKNTDSTSLAENVLKGAPTHGVIGASEPKLPLPDETASAEIQELSNLTLPPDAPTSLPPPQDLSIELPQPNPTEQYRSQALAEAITAKSQVSGLTSNNNLSNTYNATNLKDRDNLLSEIEQVQAEANLATAENNQAEAKAVYEQLNHTAGLSQPPQPRTNSTYSSHNNNKWDLQTKITKAKAKTLMTGSVIPAIGMTGINSDLPGQVMAQVSQNVYDSLTGQQILIPQGSKLIGNYESGVALGQNRLFIAWNRIIFPNGQSIDIGAMPASSGAGYAGVRDRVKNHYMKIWNNALMLSAIGASMSFATDRDKNNNGNNNTTFSSEMSSNLATTFGQAVSQSIQKNMNISPTLKIRPGFRFNVIVTKDILFN